MMNNEKIMRSRAIAGRVKRYHAWPTLHTETVAEHSWRVASLYVQLFGTPRAEVLEYILHHDLGEFSAGDMPFHAKRDVPEMKHFMDRAEEAGLCRLGIELPELTKQEQDRAKLCDLLQMMEFATIEVNMGNSYAQIVVDNIMAALKKREDKDGEVAGAALAVLLGVCKEEKDETYGVHRQSREA